MVSASYSKKHLTDGWMCGHCGMGTLPHSNRIIPNETRASFGACIKRIFKFVRLDTTPLGGVSRVFLQGLRPHHLLVRPPHRPLPTFAMDPKKLKLAVKEVRARGRLGLVHRARVRNTAKTQAFSRRVRAVAHPAFIHWSFKREYLCR